MFISFDEISDYPNTDSVFKFFFHQLPFISFIIESILNFFTGYYDGSIMVLSKEKIFFHMIKFDFWFQTLILICWYICTNGGDYKYYSLVCLFRIAKLTLYFTNITNRY